MRGPAVQRYLNAILGNLRFAGFSVEDTARAFWLLDSFVNGHVVQETSLPISTSDDWTTPGGSNEETMTSDVFPHLVEIEEHALV